MESTFLNAVGGILSGFGSFLYYGAYMNVAHVKRIRNTKYMHVKDVPAAIDAAEGDESKHGDAYIKVYGFANADNPMMDEGGCHSGAVYWRFKTGKWLLGFSSRDLIVETQAQSKMDFFVHDKGSQDVQLHIKPWAANPTIPFVHEHADNSEPERSAVLSAFLGTTMEIAYPYRFTIQEYSLPVGTPLFIMGHVHRRPDDTIVLSPPSGSWFDTSLTIVSLGDEEDVSSHISFSSCFPSLVCFSLHVFLLLFLYFILFGFRSSHLIFLSFYSESGGLCLCPLSSSSYSFSSFWCGVSLDFLFCFYLFVCMRVVSPPIRHTETHLSLIHPTRQVVNALQKSAVKRALWGTVCALSGAGCFYAARV